ncbi:hypothetical protein TNCV_195401 [Trichonephila clavipes]|uniref:Uncharacterized protein n=1 Tax=Trichonephila clavipes TaxID=2585209 RepID=A0A8X7BM55_TRICX|nr:hypothetical protein TNCV_195401 [Trichonephila clavipes]
MRFSRQTLGSSYLTPVTIRELRLALQDEWAAMPQQLIDILILSMGRRCETCLAVRNLSWELIPGVLRQTDHLTGTSARVPQRPWSRILRWVHKALALMGCGATEFFDF